jgi:hypothetical protein
VGACPPLTISQNCPIQGIHTARCSASRSSKRPRPASPFRRTRVWRPAARHTRSTSAVASRAVGTMSLARKPSNKDFACAADPARPSSDAPADRRSPDACSWSKSRKDGVEGDDGGTRRGAEERERVGEGGEAGAGAVKGVGRGGSADSSGWKPRAARSVDRWRSTRAWLPGRVAHPVSFRSGTHLSATKVGTPCQRLKVGAQYRFPHPIWARLVGRMHLARISRAKFGQFGHPKEPNRFSKHLLSRPGKKRYMNSP